MSKTKQLRNIKVRKKFLNPFFYQDPHQKWLGFCTKTHPASKFHRNLLSCFCVMLLTNQQTWHVVQSPRDLACGPCMEITLWTYRFKLWLYWSRHVSAAEYIYLFFWWLHLQHTKKSSFVSHKSLSFLGLCRLGWFIITDHGKLDIVTKQPSVES